MLAKPKEVGQTPGNDWQATIPAVGVLINFKKIEKRSSEAEGKPMVPLLS